MLRIYIQLIFPTFILFFLLNLTIRALGTIQPPDPALRGFTEGCESQSQPCWNSIVPGKSTAEVTYEQLSQLGYKIDAVIFGNTRQLVGRLPGQLDCGQITANINQRTGILYEMYIHACQLPLGEFFSTFGTASVANLDNEPCRIRVLFMNDQLQVTITHTTRLSHNIVTFGVLSAASVQISPDRDPNHLPLHWSGTLPLWKYKTRFGKPFQC